MLATRVGQPIETPSQFSSADRRFLIFELDTRGHHPGYIQHLVKYWCQQTLPGHLTALVSPKFVEQHANIVALADDHPRIEFVTISQSEEAKLFDSHKLESSFKGRIQRAFQEWALLRKYVTRLRIDHCFLMYLDTILLRLAVGGSFPCSVSAIYFRPVLHYGSFANYIPEGRESAWQWRDRVCLTRLLQFSKLQTLFCLDPFAVDYINQVYDTDKAVHLPDPVQIYDHTDAACDRLRAELGIQPNRTVFLLFGALSGRKGLTQVLDAIEALPPALCKRMSLLLIGPVAADEKDALAARVAAITETLPIQIVCRHQFVTDEAIQAYFQISDVVLAPYQRHIGMSAIMVRSAAAQKPVLSSDFGLMGELTRRYRLGLAVDSTMPSEIAQGMTRFLLESPSELCDLDNLKQFAAHNTAEQFATQIFQCLQSC